MMRIAALLALLGLMAALSACTSNGFADDFVSDNIVQETIDPGMEDTLTLTSGAEVHFPASMFNETTTVLFSDLLAGLDGEVSSYPTPTQLGEDLLAAAVVNTPVDKTYDANAGLKFAFRDGTTPEGPGTEYLVYRFDFDNFEWYRWGDTVAVVDASGDFANAVLPTDEMPGFIGSLALFKGLTAASQPAPVTTTIEGRVIDGAGSGIATSVSLYYLVGSIRLPVDALNGTIPTGGEFANVVTSDASGDFSFEVPDQLVGSLVGLVFGEFDDSVGEQDEFDILAPATVRNEAESMVVRYGVNNVISQPLN